MAYIPFLSEVDLPSNKQVCLLQELAFIYLFIILHVYRIHPLTKVKNHLFNAWVIYLLPFFPCMTWVCSDFQGFF